MSILNEADEAERAGVAAFERVEMLLGNPDGASRNEISFQSDGFGRTPDVSRRPQTTMDSSSPRSTASANKKFRLKLRFWSGTGREVVVHPNMTIESMKKLCCRGALFSNFADLF